MKYIFIKDFLCRLIALILFLCLYQPILKAQTITYSGTNVGIGSLIPGQTLDIQGTVRSLGYVNSMSLVATASPSAVSSFTISGLSPGIKYKLYLNLLQNTANGDLSIIFNADAGNNYTYQDVILENNSINYKYGSSDSKLLLTQGGAITATYSSLFEALFQTIPGNNDDVFLNCNDGFYFNAGTQYSIGLTTGIYSGSSSLSSIKVQTSAGTITGTAYLYAVQ